MRTRSARFRLGVAKGLPVLLTLILALGCSGIPPHPDVALETPADFSAPLAMAHLAALNELGARRPNGASARRARAYLDRELRLAGASPIPRGPDWPRVALPDPILAHLDSGAGEGLVLIVTAFDESGTRERIDDSDVAVAHSRIDDAGVAVARSRIDDSGVAVALELVRALGATGTPFDVVVALAAVPSAIPDGTTTEGDEASLRGRLIAAGKALADVLAAELAGEEVRAIVVLEPRAGAHPRIAKDLYSHPIYRSMFWNAAVKLGYDTLFVGEGAWSTPSGLHTGLLSADTGEESVLPMAHVVALVDVSQPAMGLPGMSPVDSRTGASSELAEAGLEAFGSVALEGIRQIMARLDRIDAFSP